MKKGNNKGFSLVELIIVIAIMAVLIGVLAPQFIKYVERSRETTDLQNIESIKRAVEVYMADYNAENDIYIYCRGEDITVRLWEAALEKDVLEEFGIANDQKMKSKKWTIDEYSGMCILYDTEKYDWVYCLDFNDPEPFSESDMPHADYFYIDGTPYEAD